MGILNDWTILLDEEGALRVYRTCGAVVRHGELRNGYPESWR
jgi:hypothetical protein